MDLVLQILERNDVRMGEKSLPKLDLHCHLDGSLSKSCIEELRGRTVSEKELQVGKECRSLAEYLEKFDLPLTCLQDEQGLKKAGYDFIKGVSKEKLNYVEVRFAPLLSCRQGLQTGQIIEAVLAGLEQGRKEFGVDYGVIVCAMRHHEPEKSLAMIKTAREYLGYGVCAADLAGNEAVYPMSQFTELFLKAKEMEMPFTIHAGECGDAKNIKDAVLCGAKRIGHGIAMKDCPEIMELCRERRIGIEMCPISNLQTKAVADQQEYPLRLFLEKGLLVTVNTDNRTVSNTTVQKEFEFIKENYGMSEDDILQMTKNAIETAFATEDVKHKLWKML